MRNMIVTSRATGILVPLILVSLPFSTVNLYAGLSFYVDGEPVPGFIGWSCVEPLPTLGIHSDTTAGWHGYVLSEGFSLGNGQIDYSKGPQGATSITPYDEPFGYEMSTDGFSEAGVQFTMEMYNDPCVYEGLITLWDANSLFHVPADTLYIWEGGAPGTCGRDFVADAGGPYRIGEGHTLRLDATGSTCTVWYCGDPEPRTGGIIGHTSLPYWHIGGVDFAFGLTAEIGYDELVNGLGLTPGTYELLLLLKWPTKGPDMASTTIVVEKYGGGTGEPNDPYQIWDANHMQAIGADANDWDKHFILMADIDLGQFDGKDGRERFNVVGRDYYNDEWVNIPFSGEFDGNNHTIASFTYDSNDDYHIGLFGYVDDPNAQIRNLCLTEPNIDVPTGEMIGSLVGRLREGTIANCSIEDGSVSGRTYVGGLVGGFMHDPAGGNSSGIVSNCHYTGSVSGDHSVGGLVGASWGTVTNCYSSGDVTGRAHVGGLVGANWGTVTNCYSWGYVAGSAYVGGLAGSNWDTVTNCYSSGDVTGDTFVGGLAGSNPGTISRCYSKSDVLAISCAGGLVGSNDGMLPVAGHAHVSGTIVECYSTGSVEGDESVGGLSGHCFEGEISNCYWDTETSKEPNMCGTDEEGICEPNCGRTTPEMKQRGTFVDWDFLNVWDIGENQTYPYLRTFSAGDINKDRVVDFRDFAIFALRWLEGSGADDGRPEVAIVYPEEGQRLMVGGIPPQTLVSAEASDADGTVVRVEFFADDTKIGEDTDGGEGWSCLWQDYSLGWHVLTAKAWDDEGLSRVSEAVNVKVWIMDPPPP